MKRYLSALILLLSGYLSATTVTGTIQDINGNRYSNGTVSAFNLITGASMTPSTTDANGTFSITLTPSTYAFTVCAKPVNIGPNGGTSVTQVCAQPATPIVISGGSQDVSTQINGVAPILGPSVAALLGANNAFLGTNTHAGLETFNGQVALNNILTGAGSAAIAGTFGGSPTMTGNWTMQGNNSSIGINTFGNINNVRWLDGVKFAQTAAGVNAADADLGSGTGEIVVPSNVTSLIGTNIVLSKHHYLVVLGNGPITFAPIRLPDSLTDSSADSGIECPDHAKLLLVANANTDFIIDQNFYTLAGSGNAHGTFKPLIYNCRIDGNKANQSALVTTGTGSISTVARNASGVVTLVFSNTPSPAFVAGMAVSVGGQGAVINEVTNDGYSFNGRYIVQSATSNSITFNDNLCLINLQCHIITTTAATGTTPIAVGYGGGGGIKLYSLAPDIRNNVIANNTCDGEWYEGNDATFTDDSTSGTGNFTGNHSMNSGCDGYVLWGPQVSHFVDTEIYGHGLWGRELFTSIHDMGTTSFNNPSGSLRVGFAGAIQESSSQETSGAGWGILVDNGTALYQTFFSMVDSAGTGVALETRSSNVQYFGQLTNSAKCAVIASAFNELHFNCTNNTGTAIDTTNSAGSNKVYADVTMSAGALQAGSWSTSDTVHLYAHGTVNSTVTQFPGTSGTTGSILFPAPGSVAQNVCYNQLDCSFSVAQTFVGSPVSINAGTVAQLRRFKVVNGTTLVTGDFGALSAGWGTTASKSSVTGEDQAGTITIASAGTGQAANPTVSLTFHDGTWTNAPICTAGRNDANAPLGQPVLVPTATTIAFTFAGTPVAGTSYTISWTCIGN